MEPDKTSKLIDEIVTIVHDTRAFVVEQAPSVAQEFLRWRTWYLTICIGIVILCAVGLVLGARYIWRVSSSCKYVEDREMGRAISVGGALLVGLGLGVIFLVCAFDLAKLLTVPRVYLLEELPKLVR